MIRFLRGLTFVAALAFAAFVAVPQADAQVAWGGLYVTGGATGQALSTTAAKVTGFTTVLPSSTTDGDQSVVASAANDNVAVVAGGVYSVRFQYSGTADATTLVTFTLRDGTTAITGASSRVNHPASTAVSSGIEWIYRPTAAGTLSVYAVAASGTPTITPTDAQLVVVRLK